MKMFKWISILFLLSEGLVFGGVNLKNGNFYISYTDIVVPGGNKSLKFVGTYNSKATEVGWRGFGWGSDYETFLKVSGDGTVVIHENGAGARTRFINKKQWTSVEVAKKAARKASERIVQAMRKVSPLTDKVANKLIDDLAKYEELRHVYSRRYNITENLKSGSVLTSNDRGLQNLVVKKDGYLRKYNNGKHEFFDKKGKLRWIKDKNGYKVSLNYNKTGRIKSIKDSDAKQLFFSWYPNGRVKEVWSAGDKKARYWYEGQNLIKSTDVADNTYKFSYDGNHNLTKVDYADKSKMTIAYHKRTQFIKEIKKRNGDTTKYNYGNNPNNSKHHYWTLVTKEGLSGRPVTNRYEYEIKVKADGAQYTHRILTVINNVKTETIYSECCSLPVKIQRGKHITNFEYDKKGLLTKKTSSRGDYVKLQYHKKFNKITRVEDNRGWTKFDYNKQGNLKEAVNNQGKKVRLTYDRKGRITTMIDKDKKKKRVLKFKYNSMGKPVEISMNKMGKINVQYDNYGEIKKVDSKQGHKMALQVTQAFQNLLAIVKPAGVNLGM